MKNEYILDWHWEMLVDRMSKTHDVGLFNPSVHTLS